MTDATARAKDQQACAHLRVLYTTEQQRREPPTT
jgi:hypothetical protein